MQEQKKNMSHKEEIEQWIQDLKQNQTEHPLEPLSPMALKEMEIWKKEIAKNPQKYKANMYLD